MVHASMRISHPRRTTLRSVPNVQVGVRRSNPKAIPLQATQIEVSVSLHTKLTRCLTLLPQILRLIDLPWPPPALFGQRFRSQQSSPKSHSWNYLRPFLLPLETESLLDPSLFVMPSTFSARKPIYQDTLPFISQYVFPERRVLGDGAYLVTASPSTGEENPQGLPVPTRY